MKILQIKLTATLLLVMFSLILTICLIGCRSINLYPLDGSHIIDVNEAQTFTAPKDGYFLSNEYFKKVLNARVKDF